MLRWIKYGVGAVVLVGVAGWTLLGSNFLSYLHTTTNAAQRAARHAVPVEFELQRASDMIEAILPDLQSQVRMIAQEEVEVAALTSDIAESQQRLKSEQKTLAMLRNTMRTQKVSYQVNGRNVERGLLTDQLHQRFERFKQGELAFASKKKL
ncbi:MAG: signal peptide-containing protein, partial [Fuerstiella sp.]|nr:signal peptide-containing protein [Fuerstiella sp.]